MGLTEFLLVVAVGGGIVAVLFATFRGAASESERVERAAGPTAALSREAEDLEERRRAAERSLEEIEADREAGDLSDADYTSLRRRYEGEIAQLGRQLSTVAAAAPAAPQQKPGGSGTGSRWRTAVAWVAGSVGFIALAWLVMSQALSPRGQNGSITGSLPGQNMGAQQSAAPLAPVDQEKLAELEREVADNPNDVEAAVELGHLYLRLQRYSDLATVTQQALRLEPDNPEALTHMGMLLFSMNHPEGVMPSFDRALEVDPDFAEALQFKGMVAFMNQDYATAVEAWERYVAVVPADQVPPRIPAMLEMARANADTTSKSN